MLLYKNTNTIFKVYLIRVFVISIFLSLNTIYKTCVRSGLLLVYVMASKCHSYNNTVITTVTLKRYFLGELVKVHVFIHGGPNVIAPKLNSSIPSLAEIGRKTGSRVACYYFLKNTCLLPLNEIKNTVKTR